MRARLFTHRGPWEKAGESPVIWVGWDLERAGWAGLEVWEVPKALVWVAAAVGVGEVEAEAEVVLGEWLPWLD
jgi:hypothetical protein